MNRTNTPITPGVEVLVAFTTDGRRRRWLGRVVSQAQDGYLIRDLRGVEHLVAAGEIRPARSAAEQDRRLALQLAILAALSTSLYVSLRLAGPPRLADVVGIGVGAATILYVLITRP